MKNIGILEIAKRYFVKENYLPILYYEKFQAEENFSWVTLCIRNKIIEGSGVLRPPGCKNEFFISLKYSPLFLSGCRFDRVDRVKVLSPHIDFNTKIHMYYDKSLCLYFPNDLPVNKIASLSNILSWTSEWVIKYEFWKKYSVWIGNEVKH